MSSAGAFRPKLVPGGADALLDESERRFDAALLRLGRRGGGEHAEAAEFLQEVVATARRVLAADRVELWLRHPEPDGALRCSVRESAEGTPSEPAPSLAPHQDRRSWTEADRPPLAPGAHRHRLESAVRRSARLVGLLAVGRDRAPFTEAERSFLASLADQVALAQDGLDRRRSVRRLRHRDALQQAVGFAAQQFLMSPNWEQAIDAVLARVGGSAEVSRVYLFRNLSAAGGSRRALQIHEWTAPRVASQVGQPAVRGMTYEELGMGRWEQLLSRGELVLGDVRELPAGERELLRSQQVRSVAAVPVFVDGRWWGFVGFDDCLGEREWSAVDVQVLQTLADLLGTAVQRKLVEDDRQRLVSLVEHGRDFIALASLDGGLEYLNPAGLDLVGIRDLDEARRHRVVDFLAGEDRARLRQQLRGLQRRGHWQGELSLRHFGSDEEIPVLFHSFLVRDPRTGAVIGVGTCGRDLRGRRKMEAELRRIDKLNALGVLAGGIAHDFNNILTAILGNIDVARRGSALPGEVAEILYEAEGACLRARSLTQQLVTFAKGGKPLLQSASLAALIEESAPFALRGSNVRCELDLDPALWNVRLDRGQISRVVDNLVLNARQAMPEGGSCRLRARNLRLGDDEQLPLPPGRYVELCVDDHGCGIPEELLSRVLDPFFTTKEKGTGLGLATAYSIVESHRGHLTLESKLGEGTRARLLLPAAAAEAPVHSDPRRVERARVGGRILVMDDDLWVREVACRSLEVLGHCCEGAADGDEALRRHGEAQRRGEAFDLVLMDLTVQGGMGGLECLEKLRERDPGVRAVVSTGYAQDPVVHHHREHGFCGVVAKPYTLAELERVVGACLAESASGESGRAAGETRSTK